MQLQRSLCNNKNNNRDDKYQRNQKKIAENGSNKLEKINFNLQFYS